MAFETVWMEKAGIPPVDEGLRPKIREFIARRLTSVPASVRARSWMGYDPAFSRDLGREGWLGLTLPLQYGGGARSAFARFVVVEELLAAGAPVAAHWIADRQSAPLILRYGSDEQRAFFLPRICGGEAFFCIGMSEPDSGSDLASVRSRATRTPDGWRLSGAKIWTTYGHRARYMIALVRTSGASEDRHRGLSQFIIDMTLPGISAAPIRDIAGDEHFAEVRFDDVELPSDALLGVEGAGWEQVNAELAFERSGPERIYSSIVLMEEWLTFVRTKARQSDAEVAIIGRLAARLSILRNMSIAITGELDRGERPIFEASIVKDLGTALEQDVPRIISDRLACDTSPVPSDLRDAAEYLSAISPSFSLRGGTREILRGMIARDLGLR